MKDHYATEFSYENFLNYAQACIDLNTYINVYNSEGFTNILMPSRGVYPFLHVANQVNTLETKMKNNLKLSKGLGLESIDVFADANFNPYHSKIWIPYTADTGINDDENNSNQIRDFWTKTFLGTIGDERFKLHSNYYQFLVQNLLKKDWEGHYKPRNIDSNGGFIYIDTVISGRAVSEILDSFQRVGFENFKGIFLVDRNGEKLKSPYKQRLEQLEREDKVVMIPVSRIFTEDKGPALGGITGFVFPQLMEEVPKYIPEFNSQVIGSGIWNFEISKRKNNSNINHTLSNARLFTLLHSMVGDILKNSIMRNPLSPQLEVLLQKEYTQKDLIARRKRNEHHLELQKYMSLDLQKHFRETKVLSQENTRQIYTTTNDFITKTEVSSSHAIRVFYNEDKLKKVLQTLGKNILS